MSTQSSESGVSEMQGEMNPVTGRYLDPTMDYKLPFERHVAESVWQRCGCQSCQEYRHLILTRPGSLIMNFETFRHKDERY
jgi:hypothetical protein